MSRFTSQAEFLSWTDTLLRNVEGMVKFALEETMKAQRGEQRYSSTLSLTSALDRGWVVNATPRPLHPREREPVSIVQGAEGTPVPVWTGADSLAPTGIRSPDCPACSESLYQLRYPSPHLRNPGNYTSLENAMRFKIAPTSTPLREPQSPPPPKEKKPCCISRYLTQGHPERRGLASGTHAPYTVVHGFELGPRHQDIQESFVVFSRTSKCQFLPLLIQFITHDNCASG